MQSHLSLPRHPYDLGSMSAALENVHSASYPRDIAPGQLRLMASDCLPTTNHGHGPVQIASTSSGQPMAPSQYFRQPFQQARPTHGFPTSYTGGSVAYCHPQSFVHPYPQPLQQLPPPQPMVYSHGSAGYYPAQQHFARQPYNQAPGIIFRQDPNYPASSHASGIPALHGCAAVRFPGQGLPQTVSTSKPVTALLPHAKAYTNALTIEKPRAGTIPSQVLRLHRLVDLRGSQSSRDMRCGVAIFLLKQISSNSKIISLAARPMKLEVSS